MMALRITDCLGKVDSFDFNIFEMDEVVGRKALKYVSFEIFNKYNFFEEILDENKYKNFIAKITEGYDRNIVYHNDLHAADVLQTMYVMLEKGNLVLVSKAIYI
jgi:cAMP-specific phosphodiesterase 4